MEHIYRLPKSLVINDIFKYLTISDLLNLRLINKKSKFILNERLVLLQINYEQFIDRDQIFEISEDLNYRIIEAYESVKYGIDHVSNYLLDEIITLCKPPLIVIQGAELTYKILHHTKNNQNWDVLVKWLRSGFKTRKQFRNYNLVRIPDDLYEEFNFDIDLYQLSKFSCAIYQITLWARAVLFINQCFRGNQDTRNFIENLKLRSRIQREIRALKRIILN